MAIVTRFWALDSPLAVVFDETYYQQNAGHYLAGTFYFNLHPPLGSLLLGAWAWLAGLSSESLLRPDPAPLLRALPALAGALIIPTFHLLLLQLGARRGVALFGAVLLLLDTANLAVSRLVLIDSFLLLFLLLAVTCVLAALRREGFARWAFAASGAAFAGMAVSVKWTGLAAVAIVIAVVLVRAATHQLDRRHAAGLVLLFTLLPAAIYLGTFALHFALLPRWGLGATMMSPPFQATLTGGPASGEGTALGFGDKLTDAHRAMLRANSDIESRTHPGASPWWSWPIQKRPLYVWQGDPGGSEGRGHLMIVGNPVVWWGTLIGLAAMGVAAALSQAARARLAPHRAALTLLVVAYLINYAPFVLIQRHLFIYSYLPAFTFSLALAVLGVEALGRRGVALAWGVGVLALVVFFYLAPLAYGRPISESGFANRLRLVERVR
jgi:dolichyl-phosphate-mannose-protein mannosyltransferase